jgi:hypothetical protein
MQIQHTALTFEELSIVRAAIRAGRYLTVIALAGLAVGVPFVFEAIAPYLGVGLLTIIFLSPLLVTLVLLLAARPPQLPRLP